MAMQQEDAAFEASERLRSAAQTALEKGDFDPLLLLLLAPPTAPATGKGGMEWVPEQSVMMRSIRKALFRRGIRGEQVETESDEIGFRFIGRRLRSGNLLKQLSESENPFGLLKISILSTVSDHLRASPRFRELEAERWAGLADPGSSPEESLQEQERQAEAAGRLSRLLTRLDSDDALLVEVTHPEAIPMPAEHIERLATRRGIPPTQVVSELEARGGTRSQTPVAEQERDARAERLRRLIERIEQVSALVEKLDGTRAVPDENLSAENVRELSSWGNLGRATPAQRSAFLLRLEVRVDSLMKTQEDASRRLERGHLSDWREIARILGEVPADATEDQLRRAANRLVTRWRRLRARMQAHNFERQP